MMAIGSSRIFLSAISALHVTFDVRGVLSGTNGKPIVSVAASGQPGYVITGSSMGKPTTQA
ncbi:hypothetical protein D0Y60_16100 [Shinella sp. WSJ-2]|uniref:hypothetical protein n=1 Tax=Shinella sp. WSJ-2 TaxID=2303749 RepID=UPI000E3C20F4|nr:hypothetical protein [Shinella sp. WSJ-2]RFZ86515.1 hypothetical protein D0Y60_16100 [Shinella sp. WSJ-2]